MSGQQALSKHDDVKLLYYMYIPSSSSLFISRGQEVGWYPEAMGVRYN